MLTLLLLTACSRPAPSNPNFDAGWPIALRTDPARPEHALVIVVDTLRADALERAHTPAMDSISARGDAASVSWSASTWTVPSITSLFTGMPVRQHGWDLPTGKIGRYPKLPDAPTLAEVLQSAGFTTTGLYANSYLNEDLGFARGFDRWTRTPDQGMVYGWEGLLAQTWSQPGRHFAYLHLLGPHSPLRPSDAARERWEIDASWFTQERYGMEIGVAKRARDEATHEAYRRGYHAVIEDTDEKIADILRLLGDQRERTLIVLTSDHGELLGEHGQFGHGHEVWDELTTVPLRVENAGDIPHHLGGDAIPLLVTRALGVDHAWPTLTALDGAAPPLVSQREGKLAMRAADSRKGAWTEGLAVYDLGADPDEARALPDDGGFGALRQRWEAAVPAGAPATEQVDLQQQAVEDLKALGYLQ